jgi:hypothetical protein
MQRSFMKIPALFVVLAALMPAGQAQITFGYTDTFEDGTTANFVHNAGNLTDPANTTGGPAGVADRYLRLVADGVGDGGKLTLQNRVQWAGNYNIAGVSRIQMDLRAFVSPNVDPLSIRIGFKVTLGPAGAGYVSTTPFTLPVDGAWHQASFDLTSMTPVNNPSGSLASVLGNVVEFRLLHSVAPNTLQGVNLIAEIGIDNISAVPEPGSAVGAAVLLAGFALHRRWNRRRQ